MAVTLVSIAAIVGTQVRQLDGAIICGRVGDRVGAGLTGRPHTHSPTVPDEGGLCAGQFAACARRMPGTAVHKLIQPDPAAATQRGFRDGPRGERLRAAAA